MFRRTTQNVVSQTTRRKLFVPNDTLSSLTPKSSFIVGLIISSPLVSPSLYKTSQQNVNNVLMATFSEQDDILDTSIEEVE